jgi:biopolymer transport protein ExbD
MSLGNLEKAEPNLVPLLDLVLQLIMFFLLCGNFLMEDLNATIKLPTAIQAKPLDKAEEYVIFLNINEKGHVLLGKGDDGTLTNPLALQAELRRYHENDVARIERLKREGKEGRLSLVVIRADKNCRFKQVYDYLEACRRVGYADVQLRAIVQSTSAR